MSGLVVHVRVRCCPPSRAQSLREGLALTYLLLTLFANMLDSASGVLGCFLSVAPGRSGLVVSLGYSVNVGITFPVSCVRALAARACIDRSWVQH